MELTGEEVVDPDRGAERIAVVTGQRDVSRLRGHRDVRVDEVEVRALRDAGEERLFSLSFDLVPADVRHLEPPDREAHDPPRQEAEPLDRAVLLAVLEQDLE